MIFEKYVLLWLAAVACRVIIPSSLYMSVYMSIHIWFYSQSILKRKTYSRWGKLKVCTTNLAACLSEGSHFTRSVCNKEFSTKCNRSHVVSAYPVQASLCQNNHKCVCHYKLGLDDKWLERYRMHPCIFWTQILKIWEEKRKITSKGSGASKTEPCPAATELINLWSQSS